MVFHSSNYCKKTMENMAFGTGEKRHEFNNCSTDNDILQHPQVILRHLGTLILFIVLDTFLGHIYHRLFIAYIGFHFSQTVTVVILGYQGLLA